MNQSESQSQIIEYLRIKPISHSQIYTFQIAIPDSEQEEISQERRDAIRRSLIEQGSNLISLIVRHTEAYSNEKAYEVVCGVDWCIVAKELGIEYLWAWVFELTDEEVAVAKAQMEQLAAAPAEEIIQIKMLWQKVEGLFQEKLENMTQKIEESVVSEVNQEGVMGLLAELEKSITKKLQLSVKSINQYVAESIKATENDLKNQILAMRCELKNAAKLAQKKEAKSELKGYAEGDAKPKSKAKLKSNLPPINGDYDSLSLRKLKAIGKEQKLRGYARMKRPEILAALKKET